MIGTIKTLIEKGFGFISCEGEEKDIFFHAHDLKNITFNELKVGDKLNFEIIDGEKGPSAKEIEKI